MNEEILVDGSSLAEGEDGEDDGSSSANSGEGEYIGYIATELGNGAARLDGDDAHEVNAFSGVHGGRRSRRVEGSCQTLGTVDLHPFRLDLHEISHICPI